MRAQNALIARRHVIYVGGYDPQGAEGYYRLFERSWKRFLTLWPLATKLGPLELDSKDFAHWDIEAAGPNWRGLSPHRVFWPKEHNPRHKAQAHRGGDSPPPRLGAPLPRPAGRSCACCARRGRSAWC